MELENKNYRSIGKWISVLHRQFQIHMNKELKKFGLNSSQFIFLIHLFKVDNVSQEELAKALCIDKSATARAIKQLEDNGFIERVSNPDDKRVKLVRCTEKGISFKKDMFDILVSWNEKITSRLDENEYDIVYTALIKMSEEVLPN